VVDWVNTFEGVEVESLDQFYSGQLMGQVLAIMAPSYFEDLNAMDGASENWALNASNIKKLIRSLESYFKTALEKGITDLEDIDANSIAKNHDQDMLFSLLEIVVGVAVLCEDKSEFIQHIFSLDESSQLVLKDMVEHVMQRVYDLEDEEEEEEEEEEHEEANENFNELLVTAQEAISELKSEKQQLLQNIGDLTIANTDLKSALEKMKEEEFQKDVTRDNDRSRAQANAHAQSTLQQSLEELQTKLNETVNENESLREELTSSRRQLEEHEHTRARMEVEALQMSDEIDLARDKALKLTKAEATIEKYQQKMEDMKALKAQNKELEQNLDKYLEQIHDLESADKSAQSTIKMVEEYKNKSVKLERERFEATSALAMKDDEVTRLQAELNNAMDEKNRMEEDLVSVTTRLELTESELAESKEKEEGSAGGIYDTPAALKEKIRHLEMELRKQKSAEGADQTRTESGEETTQSSEEVSYMINVLKTELEVTQEAKKEREEALVAIKKQLADSNYELKKAQTAAEKSATKESDVKESAAQQAHTKKLETELAIKVNALLHLEELLKESESKMNKAEHDKVKLEIFAKRSLNSFKDKYMTALQRYKAEKAALEEKLKATNEKLENEQNKHRKEERLMLSAVYEMGVNVIEKNINLQIHDSAATPHTFLGTQRAEQEARMTPRGKGGHPSSTPKTSRK